MKDPHSLPGTHWLHALSGNRLPQTVATLMIAAILTGCGGSAPPATDSGGPQTSETVDQTPPVQNPREIPLTPETSARITVQTLPPGCMVYCDLVPVRTENDTLAMTPCEFVAPRGTHTVSVERPGGKRSSLQINLRDDQELEFDVSETPRELDDPSLLNAALFEAAIGRLIPLASLNSTGREWDPFLSPDGLSIYFASDRDGNKGIYTARRPSPYHDFDPPTLIGASSGADMPLSPSVSADNLVLTYGIQDKARIWQLLRESEEVPFEMKEIIRSEDTADHPWLSAQLSSDGLRLYWSEEGPLRVTRAAVRSSPGKLFGKTLAFELPGGHPHLSSDGLRQYALADGKLMRARRGTVKQAFGPLEPVLDTPLEGFELDESHRQFWVTDDEQWMFVSDPSQQAGDLFVIRLSDGPLWGRNYVARPVENTMTVAATTPAETTPEPMPAPVDDSLSKPLPYTAHWSALRELLDKGDGDAAVKLVTEAMEDPALQADKSLLAWDLEDASALAAFQADVRRGLAGLKAGAPIRIGGTKFEFVSADRDMIQVRLKEKDLSRTLDQLTPGEKIAVAEEAAEPLEPIHVATYLFYQGPQLRSLADSWLKKAGDNARPFAERLAGRSLAQGKAEMARGKIAEAIAFLNAASTLAPGTRTEELAQTQRASVYDSLTWKPVGARQWKRGDHGEYTAEPTRTNDSYLASDRPYRDFELTCEWKVTVPGAMGGIFFRYDGSGKPLENGVKLQLANDSDLRRMDRFATGALFAVTSPSANASLPQGQWNTLRLRVRETAVQAWINDKEVLQTKLADSVASSGTILLDGVAGGISYRKVLVYDVFDPPPQ